MNDRPGRTRVIVGAGTAIVAPDGKLLVVLQKHPLGRDWGYVGGGLEAGETIEDCAIREAYEETGLRIRLKRLLVVDQFWRDGAVYGLGFVFLAEPDGWPQQVVLPEKDGSASFLAHRWLTRADFDALAGDPEYDLAQLPWPEDVEGPLFRRRDG